LIRLDLFDLESKSKNDFFRASNPASALAFGTAIVMAAATTPAVYKTRIRKAGLKASFRVHPTLCERLEMEEKSPIFRDTTTKIQAKWNLRVHKVYTLFVGGLA
jgi:hypothetical protein